MYIYILVTVRVSVFCVHRPSVCDPGAAEPGGQGGGHRPPPPHFTHAAVLALAI